jgi:Arm DNA-binding domain
MGKITKRSVESATVKGIDHIIWDDGLSGFGVRIFASGKRSYLIHYRAQGRSRRFTIGSQGVWTPEIARREPTAQLGRVARGENPAEERHLDTQAITAKELYRLYLADLDVGLILGKRGWPKKHSMIATDTGADHPPHHTAPNATPSEGCDKGRCEQGHEGHHGGQDRH